VLKLLIIPMTKTNSRARAVVHNHEVHRWTKHLSARVGTMPRTYHAMKTACLKENHEVKTMQDLLVLASRHRTHNHWNDS
jgi:hypothetical protein